MCPTLQLHTAYRTHSMLAVGGVGVEPDGTPDELQGTLLLRMFGEVGGLLLGTTPLLPVHGFVVITATVVPSLLLLLLLLLYFTVSEGAADNTLPLEEDAGKNLNLEGNKSKLFESNPYVMQQDRQCFLIEFIHNTWWLDMFWTSMVHPQERL